MVPFRRLRHDQQRAAFLPVRPALRAEQHVRLRVRAARQDLVESFVPQDCYQRRAWCDRGREFGFQRGGVEDVEVAGFGARDDGG